jgi:hypothetical protein
MNAIELLSGGARFDAGSQGDAGTGCRGDGRQIHIALLPVRFRWVLSRGGGSPEDGFVPSNQDPQSTI